MIHFFTQRIHNIFFSFYVASNVFHMFVTFITLLVIIFVVPQTPKKNLVIRLLTTNKSSFKFFANYAEAKQLLHRFTWFFIFLYILLHFLSGIFF